MKMNDTEKILTEKKISQQNMINLSAVESNAALMDEEEQKATLRGLNNTRLIWEELGRRLEEQEEFIQSVLSAVDKGVKGLR